MKKLFLLMLGLLCLPGIQISAQCVSASFTSTAPACQTTMISFTNTSGNLGGGWTYFWDFDYPNGGGATPATSTTQNPNNINYTPGGNGVYTVAFTITNIGLGCSSTVLMDIDIRTARADFSISNPIVCEGDSFRAYNMGTPGSSPTATVTHSWSFGLGATPSTSTAINPPSVVYSSPGLKTITHYVAVNYGACGGNRTDVVTQNVTVNPSPIPSFTSNTPACAGTNVNFNYTGSTAATYAWDFGSSASPQLSNAQNPNNISYSIPGSKTITLTTINGYGCSRSTTQNISINATPSASFTSTAPGCTGMTVDFTNTGTVSGTTWLWNFGAGATPATSTAQDPSGVVYSSPGIKTVTLTTTNSSTGCAVTATQTININQTPTPVFTSTAPQCQDAAITFAYTGTTGTGWTYAWDFGNGASPAISSAQNPGNVLYSSAGTQTVTLVVTNNGLCAQTTTQTINILATPSASFTSTAPGCTGRNVDFTNTGTVSGTTWLWDFGVGASPTTSTAQDPSGVVYSSPGIKTVTLTTTNSSTGCAVTATQTINVNQTPSVSFNSNASQCMGTGLNFTNTGSTGSNWSYSWDFGLNGTPQTSSSENPSGILYNSPGTKIITMTISDAYCTNTATQTINIDPLPAVNAGRDTTICANTSVQIGAASLAGFTYSWFPASTLNNATASNPVASPIAPVTTYIVTMTNSTTGCQAVDSVVVTMLSPLIAAAGIDAEICRYDSIQIGAALLEGQNYSWSPSIGLSNVSSPNPVASPAATTTYTLTVTGSGCAAETDQVTVIVHQLPIANAGPDDTITSGAQTQLVATGGVQYTWAPPYGLSNTGIYNPIASPDSTTSYIVYVIDIYGCRNSDTMTLKVLTPSFWIPTAFTPDGNGQNDVLYVRGEGITGFEFGIYNRWGELIFVSKDLNTGWDGRRQTTNEEMSSGAYMYYIKGTKTDGDPVNAKGLVNLIR